jgi:uncharacterized protein (TIRG00374 family)
MLHSYGFGSAPSTATIGVTSVWNVWITLALPVLGLIAIALVGQGDAAAVGITLVATAVIVAGVVVFALILKNESTARKIGGWGNSLIAWAAGLFNKEIDVDAVRGIVEFRSSIIDVVRDRWLIITAANLFQQLAQFSILYLAVVALQGGLDGPVSFGEALAAFSFGRLATFIPVPPGGLGTTDAIIAGLLTTFGLPNTDALAATMIWRAATYFPQLLVGILTLLIYRRRQAKGEVAQVA